jgi:heterodisulfide reductase subunit A-like polyferredoxin
MTSIERTAYPRFKRLITAHELTDFAGETGAADAPLLRDCAPPKRVAMLACLVHKTRMRTRDDLATMFCKRVATKVKRAKEELKEIRDHQQAIVEALVGNYWSLLKNVDADGPAQSARAKAAELTEDVATTNRLCATAAIIITAINEWL